VVGVLSGAMNGARLRKPLRQKVLDKNLSQ
jgi:hypothetical protein